MDIAVGITRIVLPPIAGFSDNGGATRFFVVAGRLTSDLRQAIAPG